MLTFQLNYENHFIRAPLNIHLGAGIKQECCLLPGAIVCVCVCGMRACQVCFGAVNYTHPSAHECVCGVSWDRFRYLIAPTRLGAGCIFCYLEDFRL